MRAVQGADDARQIGGTRLCALRRGRRLHPSLPWLQSIDASVKLRVPRFVMPCPEGAAPGAWAVPAGAKEDIVNKIGDHGGIK